jgi:hypothetical protein
MKLFLLKQKGKVDYDCAAGFVVRAESEEAARQHIVNSGLLELCGCCPLQYYGDEQAATWSNPEYSTCDEISLDGPAQIILRDFRAG